MGQWLRRIRGRLGLRLVDCKTLELSVPIHATHTKLVSRVGRKC